MRAEPSEARDLLWRAGRYLALAALGLLTLVTSWGAADGTWLAPLTGH